MPSRVLHAALIFLLFMLPWLCLFPATANKLYIPLSVANVSDNSSVYTQQNALICICYIRRCIIVMHDGCTVCMLIL